MASKGDFLNGQAKGELLGYIILLIYQWEGKDQALELQGVGGVVK